MERTSERPVFLSAMQPTGNLHLGNYLGAARNWLPMLDEYLCFIPIVDMHAITLPYVPAELRRNTYTCLAQYIACGLDPEKCWIFAQSHVVGHTELAWLLGCLTPVGQLQRMTQFKDKASKQKGAVNSGLLFYPVLMAADILLYNADIVPVGDDQKQHLELARDIAKRFNSTYSPTFKIPEPYMSGSGSRLMSLQDPKSKMAKSDSNRKATIFLLDPPEVVRKKIMSAVTDTGREVRAGEDKPAIANLLNILSASTGTPVDQLESSFAHAGYAEFKEAVADAVIELLTPVRKRYGEIVEDRAYLEKVLRDGAAAAQRRADRMLKKVYRKAGFAELPK